MLNCDRPPQRRKIGVRQGCSEEWLCYPEVTRGSSTPTGQGEAPRGSNQTALQELCLQGFVGSIGLDCSEVGQQLPANCGTSVTPGVAQCRLAPQRAIHSSRRAEFTRLGMHGILHSV